MKETPPVLTKKPEEKKTTFETPSTDKKNTAPLVKEEKTDEAKVKTTTAIAVPKKKPAPKVPKNMAGIDADLKDYSHLYKSFYDIFVGFQID